MFRLYIRVDPNAQYTQHTANKVCDNESTAVVKAGVTTDAACKTECSALSGYKTGAVVANGVLNCFGY